MAILWNFTIINLTVVFWGYGNFTILSTVVISSNFTEVYHVTVKMPQYFGTVVVPVDTMVSI